VTWRGRRDVLDGHWHAVGEVEDRVAGGAATTTTVAHEGKHGEGDEEEHEGDADPT
jgi:hypothetical protein